jgi:protein TonB
MWQSVTISPGNRGGRNRAPLPDSTGACGGLCFLFFAALHLLIPVLVRFSPPLKKGTETGEMALTFESFAVPAAAPVRPAMPPVIPPAVPETALPETPVTPEAVTETFVPAAAFPENTGGGDGGTALAAGETGAPGQGAEADYLALILRRLEEKKVYPLSVRKRGLEGDVTVAFTIAQNGAVTGITLGDSAHRFLGQAAIETVHAASPFPVRPAQHNQGKDYPVRVTIRYKLEEE